MEQTFVVFVDMLGFADLVERDSTSIDKLRPVFKSANGLDVADHGASESVASELVNRFTHFHRCLNSARNRVEAARDGAVVVFSDSAFLQTKSLKAAAEVARELMRNLIFRGVPARIGIAGGSFRSSGS